MAHPQIPQSYQHLILNKSYTIIKLPYFWYPNSNASKGAPNRNTFLQASRRQIPLREEYQHVFLKIASNNILNNGEKKFNPDQTFSDRQLKSTLLTLTSRKGKITDYPAYNQMLLQGFAAFKHFSPSSDQINVTAVFRMIKLDVSPQAEKKSIFVFKKIFREAHAINELYSEFGNVICENFDYSHEILSKNKNTTVQIVQFLQKVLRNRLLIIIGKVKCETKNYNRLLIIFHSDQKLYNPPNDDSTGSVSNPILQPDSDSSNDRDEDETMSDELLEQVRKANKGCEVCETHS